MVIHTARLDAAREAFWRWVRTGAGAGMVDIDDGPNLDGLLTAIIEGADSADRLREPRNAEGLQPHFRE
jgi:hypothetical protein